jgi:hypothetical protein
MRLNWSVVVVGILAMCADARAVTNAGPEAVESTPGRSQAMLEEVLVIGEQPGPGLWRVTSPGGDGHVLWLLGSYAPLPKKMKWRSRELERVMGESQVLLAPPDVDAKIGPLGGLTLLPSLIGVRNNPNGERLEDVVPPELYERWRPLKARYIGSDDDVEKWRPIFAAQELYLKALRQTGLEPYGVVWPVVEKLARRHKLEVTTPQVRVEIEKPRAAIKEFKRSPLADVECFARTIERLESDLDLMRVRANAWATGDVARLHDLSHVDQASTCIAVVMNSQLARERGWTDLPARAAAAWLDAAEHALARNPSTIAVLSIDRLLAPEGYLAALRAKGYTVEEP